MSEITVGNVDEIPVGEGRTFAVHGEQIAVYRMRDGSLRAIGAVCPLHGLAYDLRTGAETTGTGPGVCSHPVSAEHDGSIRLTLECA
jgi:nitrite reductase (NADH) small subunit